MYDFEARCRYEEKVALSCKLAVEIKLPPKFLDYVKPDRFDPERLGKIAGDEAYLVPIKHVSEIQKNLKLPLKVHYAAERLESLTGMEHKKALELLWNIVDNTGKLPDVYELGMLINHGVDCEEATDEKLEKNRSQNCSC